MDRSVGEGRRSRALPPNHDEDFRDLGADNDGAFAETVRQKSAVHGKKQKGSDEKGGYDGRPDIPLLQGSGGMQGDHEQESLVCIVIESALELGDDQCPESAIIL